MRMNMRMHMHMHMHIITITLASNNMVHAGVAARMAYFLQL